MGIKETKIESVELYNIVLDYIARLEEMAKEATDRSMLDEAIENYKKLANTYKPNKGK